MHTMHIFKFIDITELLSVNISVYFTSKAMPSVRIKIKVRFISLVPRRSQFFSVAHVALKGWEWGWG